MIPDFYQILGIDKKATQEEVRSAYRKMAKMYHPDANQGNTDHEEAFKLITKAYHVLSDPQKRPIYDMKLMDYHKQGNYYGGQAYSRPDTQSTVYRRKRTYRYYRPAYQRYTEKTYTKTQYFFVGVFLVIFLAAVFIIPITLFRLSSEHHYNNGVENYQSGEYWEALQSLDHAMVEFGDKKTDASLLAGKILINKFDQHVKAIEYLKKGLNESKDTVKNKEFSTLLGDCYVKKSQYKTAKEYYEKGLQKGTYDSVYLKLANIQAFHLGEYEEAANRFKKYLNTHNQDIMAHYGLGYAYFKKGDYENAISQLNIYINKKGKINLAYFLLGKAYINTNQHKKACEPLLFAAKNNIADARTLYRQHCGYIFK